MNKKLTPWFPADVKPVRVGVYEKDFGVGPSEYQYWDGVRWHYGNKTPELTMEHQRHGLKPFPRRWRGLAEQPKGPQ